MNKLKELRPMTKGEREIAKGLDDFFDKKDKKLTKDKPISIIIKAPKYFITGKKKDKDKFVNQLHIISKQKTTI